MVLTITPMVHGGRRLNWVLSVGLHSLGGAVGGAVVASGAALIGLLLASASLREVSIALAAAILVIALLVDTQLVPIRVPSPKRQVPQRWREVLSPRWTAFAYGLELGTGVTTRVYFAATYAVFIVAGLVLGFPAAVGVGAAYGLARGLSVWIAHDGLSLESLERAIDRRVRYAVVARGANVVTVSAVAAALTLSTL